MGLEREEEESVNGIAHGHAHCLDARCVHSDPPHGLY
jgi:hypothetical protein